jgi:hypothetical protein
MMADKDTHFLQKPFSPATLAELTRQVLGGMREDEAVREEVRER